MRELCLDRCESRSQRDGERRHLGFRWDRIAADVLVPQQVQRLDRAQIGALHRLDKADEAHRRRLRRGARQRIERCERVEPGRLSEQEEFEHAQLERMGEPADPEHRTDIREAQGRGRAETECPRHRTTGDQRELRTGQIEGGAQRRLVTEERLGKFCRKLP